MYDSIIIGGGIIGLSLAHELSKRNQNVCVLDKQTPGREASWAGAGMLPPGSNKANAKPWDQLGALSLALHKELAAELKEKVGIDTGFRKTGAVYVARSQEEAELLKAKEADWKNLGIKYEELSQSKLQEIEPALDIQPNTLAIGISDDAKTADDFLAFLLPDEYQFRSPWHLRALLAACKKNGVNIRANTPVTGFNVTDGCITSVETSRGPIEGKNICLAAGSWAGILAEKLGLPNLSIEPLRGQIVLLNRPLSIKPHRHGIRHIVNVGKRYLVPREDGRVLVGSTEENVGFNTEPTEEAVASLLDYAKGLAPILAHYNLEAAWAGLRPNSPDNQPFIGAIPNFKNAWIAAGHYRNGLIQSTGTAAVMSSLIRGEEPEIDISAFSVERITEAAV